MSSQALVTGGLILIACAACFGDPQRWCSNSVISAATSTDGTRKAILFYRSCGALSHERVAVSVVPSSEALPADDDGNVYQHVDTVRLPASLDSKNHARLPKLEWTSDAELLVSCDPRAVIWKRVERIGPVRVEYRELDPP